jgi:hypothetical protein
MKATRAEGGGVSEQGEAYEQGGAYEQVTRYIYSTNIKNWSRPPQNHCNWV